MAMAFEWAAKKVNIEKMTTAVEFLVAGGWKMGFESQKMVFLIRKF